MEKRGVEQRRQREGEGVSATVPNVHLASQRIADAASAEHNFRLHATVDLELLLVVLHVEGSRVGMHCALLRDVGNAARPTVYEAREGLAKKGNTGKKEGLHGTTDTHPTDGSCEQHIKMYFTTRRSRSSESSDS